MIQKEIDPTESETEIFTFTRLCDASLIDLMRICKIGNSYYNIDILLKYWVEKKELVDPISNQLLPEDELKKILVSYGKTNLWRNCKKSFEYISNA